MKLLFSGILCWLLMYIKLKSKIIFSELAKYIYLVALFQENTAIPRQKKHMRGF